MARDSATPVAPPDLSGLLCFALHSTGFAFTRIYRRKLQRLGLTYPQYLVMVALWGEGEVTVGRLGQLLSLETSTLTPVLKRLEGAGLLTRRRCATDERRVMVALTDKGQAMRQEAAEITRCVVESTGLPVADLVRLTGEIQLLRSNLEQAAAKADHQD